MSEPEPNPTRKERKRARLEAEKAKRAAMSPGQRFAYEIWAWVKAIVIAIVVLTPIRVMLLDWNDIPSGSMTPTMLTGDRIIVNKHDYGVRWPVPWMRLWIAQWGGPNRGDIVTWHNPDNPGGAITMVKRVVGVPGDTVVMQNSRVILNGEPVRYELVDSDVTQRMDNGQAGVFDVYREFLPNREGEEVGHLVQFSAEAERFLDVARRRAEAQGVPLVVRTLREGEPFNPRLRYEFVLGEDEYLMIGDNRDQSQDSRFPLYGPVPRNHVYGSSGRIAISLNRGGNWMPRFGRFFRGVE